MEDTGFPVAFILCQVKHTRYMSVVADCEDFSVAPIVLSSSPPSSSHMINDKSRDLAVNSLTLAQNSTTAAG